MAYKMNLIKSLKDTLVQVSKKENVKRFPT